MHRLHRIAACVVVLGVGSGRAAAQVAPPRAVPGTIAGIVVDLAGAPIVGAEVTYGDDRVRTVTSQDGTFRFANLRRDSYVVTVRRVGFAPQSREVEVADSGAVVRFVLVPIARALPPAVTRANRPGLSGIVTDSAFRPLAGVMITAEGGAARNAETDSTGRYAIPAAEGHYLVRASVDGYRSASVSVNVQRDSGRDVSFRLVPDPAYSLVRERIADAIRRQRLATRSPVRSRVYTRDDIAKSGATNLDDFIRRSGLGGSACLVTLNDDGMTPVPTWAVDLADIEFLELYDGGGGAVDRARTGMSSMTVSRRGCGISAFAVVPR